MPELPEVETMARDLDHEIAGARVERVRITRPDVLREATPRQFAARLKGAAIVRCWRRAKLVVIDFTNAYHVAIQPRFTGGLLVDRGDLPEPERQYSTVEWLLEDGRSFHYRDVRRLGTVALMDDERFREYSGELGVEPLEPAFTPARLAAIVRGSRQAVKKVIMDQYLVVGVGNIYANEALWRAGIDPSRAARTLHPDEVERLHADIVAVLREAIAARGTSFRDYRDARGERGEFEVRLAAYGRAGEPCVRCGRKLVGTHAVDGRQTVLCISCQR